MGSARMARSRPRRTDGIERLGSSSGPRVGLRLRLLALVVLLCAPHPVLGEPEGRTVRVTRGPILSELIEAGELRAIFSREITAPLEWRLDLQIVRLAPEGVVVAPGDTLVQFDTASLERELNEALAQRAEREADLQRIEAEQGSKRLQLRNQLQQAAFRAEQAALQQEKLAFESEAQRQQARLELEKARIARAEAEAKLRAQAILDSLESSKARIRIAEASDRVRAEKAQIASMTLTAPIEGLVVHGAANEAGRKLREGDTVQSGQTVVRLPDLSRMEVVVEVNEVDRERVFVGQSARVSLDAYPDLDLPGEVTHLARLALPPRRDSAVRVFEISVRVDGGDERLKPGMTAQARLALDRREETLRIPRTAVFSDPSGVSVVFPREGWPRPRTVRTGLASPRWVEGLEGVRDGEVLVAFRPPEADVAPWRGPAESASAAVEAPENADPEPRETK